MTERIESGIGMELKIENDPTLFKGQKHYANKFSLDSAQKYRITYGHKESDHFYFIPKINLLNKSLIEILVKESLIVLRVGILPIYLNSKRESIQITPNNAYELDFSATNVSLSLQKLNPYDHHTKPLISIKRGLHSRILDVVYASEPEIPPVIKPKTRRIKDNKSPLTKKTPNNSSA